MARLNNWTPTCFRPKTTWQLDSLHCAVLCWSGWCVCLWVLFLFLVFLLRRGGRRGREWVDVCVCGGGGWFVCGVCCAFLLVLHFKTFPCVRSKRSRVCRQNARVSPPIMAVPRSQNLKEIEKVVLTRARSTSYSRADCRRSHGEKCNYRGAAGHEKLRKFLEAWQITPEVRAEPCFGADGRLRRRSHAAWQGADCGLVCVQLHSSWLSPPLRISGSRNSW